MSVFKKQPKTREVYLSKESGNDFPLDKKNRPLICKKAGAKTSIFNAMSSKEGKGKIKVTQDDFQGNVKIKKDCLSNESPFFFSLPNFLPRTSVNKETIDSCADKEFNQVS